MQIGMIGMGRMGSAMARRLLRAGHRVVAHDVIAQASSAIARDGAVIAGTIAELADKLISALRSAFGGHAESPA